MARLGYALKHMARRFVLAVAIFLTGQSQAPIDPIVVGPKPMVVMPPPVVRPINWEPFLLTGAGAVMLGIGAWRLAAAEADYQTLRALSASSAPSGEAVLDQARARVQSGKLNTGLGWVLLSTGTAAVGASIVWLFIEGIQKDPLVMITPTFDGALASFQTRF